ncbi:MAG: hypothetical protein JXA99_17290 [Candidatus Lokiarchaeota archaeon]|nr:hypothetical protein [Candidatus Lokiarchaeota archaeon]
MKIFNKIVIILFFLLLYFSQPNYSQDKNNIPEISYDYAVKIIQNKYYKTPDTLCIEKYNNRTLIAALIQKESLYDNMVILTNIANTWQELINFEIYRSLIELNFTDVDSNIYLYYSILNSGSTMGSVVFYLFDIAANTQYEISFSGYHGKYDEMEISDNLNNKKNLFYFLEKKASESEYVYKPTEEDLDIDNPKNYETKWRILNPNLYSLLKTNNKIELIMPEYDDALFDFDINYGDITNNKYNIRAETKGSVLGYDKSNKKYFVIWVPETKSSYIHNVTFINDYEILCENSPECYRIDLLNKKIQRCY